MNLPKSKLIMGIVGTAVAIGFALTPVIVSADTASDLQAQINSLLATIQSLQAQLSAVTGGSSSTGTGYTFNTNLTVGSTGADVMNLQKVLNMSADTQVASTGAGSPGNESSYFGALTKAAVAKFQTKNGISPAAGYVGPITRAKLNSMGGTTGTTGTTGGTTPVVGGSLVFAPATQPANSLAPQGAARVPFTTFTLTNTGTNVATINGVTVQRTGLGQDAVFSGVVLVDNNNIQIGTSKTFNSNHQTAVGDTFTVNPGETKTLTVAGNMAAALTNYAGQVVSISVVGVNSTATVSGSFPVTGAAQTINASLTIGSVSTSTSAFDPGADQPSRNIGDMAVRISGVKFTANSAEDLKLYSVRWRQVGTASASDISNVVTNVNGTTYPTVVSSDGKYYTSVFPGGILIPKGNSIEVYTQADLTGTNAASRTVRLDIDKVTDVYFVGQLYGFGVAPSGTYTPWFKGYTTTINAGTVTTISKANEVTAQNIASNVNNQVLGGFATNFAGESVSVQSMVFSVATSGAIGGLLTSVSLVDSNGAVVAGPVDATWTSGNNPELVTFTDTVTFSTGRHVYTLKGKVPSGATNGATITMSTTPSGWSNVTGQTSGNSITISTGSFSMNAVTVKAAALAVNISTQPTSQNIVAGVQNLVLANFQLDASQSGEDIRLSSLPVKITVAASGILTHLSGCALWNGSSQLTTGSRVQNSPATASTTVFSFDNSLTVAKGTIVTLALSCNVSSSATAGTYQVTADTTNGDYAITGVTSGNSVTTSAGLTLGSANGGTMTVTSGSLAMSVDPSSPSYTVVAGGTTGVTVGVIKLRPTNEAINVTKLGLTLSLGSSTDVIAAHLYNGATLIGDATFTGNNTSATSTLLGAGISLTKDVDTLITIKADFADIGTSMSGVEGKFVKLDPANAQGTGVSSGGTINASSTAASNVAGVRVFNSYPTLALGTLPSGSGADGRLMHFSVTANAAGPVGIQRITFSLATTVSTVSNVGLYAYTGSDYSTGAISGQGNSGQIGSNITLTYPSGTGTTVIATSSPTTSPVQVPAGTTYYFELRGSVTGGGTTGSVVTTLLGDAAYPANNNPIDTGPGFAVATSGAMTATGETTGANFIWSGNATSTSVTGDVDWSNGYGLPGLGSNGLIQARAN